MSDSYAAQMVSVNGPAAGTTTITIPKVLLEMGQKMLADARSNDHCTKNPLFEVQRLRKITGIDPDYAETFLWICDGEEVTDDAERAKVQAEYDETGNEPDGYQRVGYVEEWETADCMVFFTPQAAQAAMQGKDPSAWRVSVNSAYRNHEFKAIQEYLQVVALLAETHAPQPMYTQPVNLPMPVKFDKDLGCLYDIFAMHRHLVRCAESVVLPPDAKDDPSLVGLPEVPQPAKTLSSREAEPWTEPMALFTEAQMRAYGNTYAVAARLMFARTDEQNESSLSPIEAVRPA